MLDCVDIYAFVRHLHHSISCKWSHGTRSLQSETTQNDVAMPSSERKDRFPDFCLPLFPSAANYRANSSQNTTTLHAAPRRCLVCDGSQGCVVVCRSIFFIFDWSHNLLTRLNQSSPTNNNNSRVAAFVLLSSYASF